MNVFTKLIYDDLIELSDIEMQKRYWLDNDPVHISSYTELYCRLFDDNSFDAFVDKEALGYGIPLDVIAQLIVIRDLLIQYDEGDKSDEEIVYDPEWLNIVNYTKSIMARLKIALQIGSDA